MRQVEEERRCLVFRPGVVLDDLDRLVGELEQVQIQDRASVQCQLGQDWPQVNGQILQRFFKIKFFNLRTVVTLVKICIFPLRFIEIKFNLMDQC